MNSKRKEKKIIKEKNKRDNLIDLILSKDVSYSRDYKGDPMVKKTPDELISCVASVINSNGLK